MKIISEVLEDFKTASKDLKAELEPFLAPFAAVLPDGRRRHRIHRHSGHHSARDDPRSPAGTHDQCQHDLLHGRTTAWGA